MKSWFIFPPYLDSRQSIDAMFSTSPKQHFCTTSQSWKHGNCIFLLKDCISEFPHCWL